MLEKQFQDGQSKKYIWQYSENLLYEYAKLVIAIVYSSTCSTTVARFLEDRGEYLKNMSVCLLAETGSKFREEYFPSLGNIAPKILLLWRGLFDELIVLSQHSLSNANLFQNIAKDVKRRQNYEMAVKSYFYYSPSSEYHSSYKVIGLPY